MTGLSYGTELPDQVDGLNNVFEKQLALLTDARELIKERAALEREYAQKLQGIARRAAEKRVRSAAARVVGEDPAKVHNEDVLKRNTLEAAYTMLIESYDASAHDHQTFSETLISQITQDLKVIEQKKDDLRRKELQAFRAALADRDKIYNDRLKAKQKYDDACLEYDGYRQKQERAGDDKHADRAAKQYEGQKVEMLNAKNTYLTAIAVANKVKRKFYGVDLPGIENRIQLIQHSLTSSLHRVFRQAHRVHAQLINSLQYKLSLFDKSLVAFDPLKDQDLFIEYNRRIGPSAFREPDDWVWEPCPGYYDAGEMSVETEPKILLQNKLARSQMKLDEVQATLKVKAHEASQLQKLAESSQLDDKLGDQNEILNNYLDAQHASMQLATAETVLDGEIEVLVNALGDDQGAGQPHSFKSSSFSIPTPCGFCKSSIWGLSKQGKTCKACGLSVHSKCELKVPAECQGAAGKKTHRSTANVSRTITNTSGVASKLSVASSAGDASAFGVMSPSLPEVNILFDFVATSEYELNVSAGERVQVIEEDDGSGWVKVKNSMNMSGLVPASYISESTGAVGRGGSPKQHGSGKFVKGIYEYVAQGDDELSVAVGGRIELTAVGDSYADGWSEGIDSNGRMGIFPSNYVVPL